MSDIELGVSEQILAVVRRGVYRELPRLCFAVIILLLPFFFFFPLMQLGGFGFVIFVTILACAGCYAAKVWVVWYYSVLIVTDARLIDAEQCGLFAREITEVEASDIDRIEHERQGLLQKMCGLSTIHLRTGKEHDFDLVVKDVRYAERLISLVDALRDMPKKPSGAQKQEVQSIKKKHDKTSAK